jgi:hypothetical protein
MAIRPATMADLDAVVDVVINAMPDDPQWTYRFPYRHEFPEDHLKYTKMLYQLFIDPSYDDWFVLVKEAPSIEDSNVSKIVAFSVWDVSYINKAKHGPDYERQNRS